MRIKKWTRKGHFQDKREITRRKLWDVEFLLDQYQQMREGFRVEYDAVKEMLDGTETYEILVRKLGVEMAKDLMKNADKAYAKREEVKDIPDLKDLPKDEKDILVTLQNEIQGKKDDMARLEKQMNDVSLMIDGDPENPNAVDPRDPPINQKIANFRSVIDTLDRIIKSS